MKYAILAIAATLIFTSPVQARHIRHHRHSYPHASHFRLDAQGCVFDNSGHETCGGPKIALYSNPAAISPVENNRGQIVGHPAGCPHIAFCGCGVSVWAFGHSVRSLWPAAAYYRFPRDVAANGNVVIYGRHHVAGIIQSYGDGTALLYDPNSGGHLTRIWRRSIRGATIVNPHGARVVNL